jgi:hypothetical protein
MIEAVRLLGNSSRILVFRDLSFTLRSPNMEELNIADEYMMKRGVILLQFRVYRIFQ